MDNTGSILSFRNSILLIALLAISISIFSLIQIYPSGYDSFYHMAISKEFSEGNLMEYDYRSAAPQGRPHLYPPAFHILSADLILLSNLDIITIFRVLPLIFLISSALAFWIFVKKMYDEKMASYATVLFLLSPTYFVRGLTPTPESLGIVLVSIILFLSLRNSLILTTLILGFLGILSTFSFIVGVICVIIFAKRRVLIIIGALLLSAPFWYVLLLYYLKGFGIHQFLSYTNLIYYPKRLGYVQTILSFFSLSFDSVTLFASVIFILSQSHHLFIVTSDRFVTFLAIPISLLAGRKIAGIENLYRLKIKNEIIEIRKETIILPLFLIVLLQAIFFLNNTDVLISNHELDSYEYLSVISKDSVVLSEWQVAPKILFFSPQRSVKGAFGYSIVDLEERNRDVKKMLKGNQSLLREYHVNSIYVSNKEIEEGFDENLFGSTISKVYFTKDISIYNYFPVKIRISSWPNAKKGAFTIFYDDVSPYYSLDCLDYFLSTVNEKGGKVDLFVIPNHMNKYKITNASPEWKEYIKRASIKNELGLHGFYHNGEDCDCYWEKDYEEQKENIMEGIRLFDSTFNTIPQGFRPPGWKYNDDTVSVLRDLNFAYSATTWYYGKNNSSTNKIFPFWRENLLEIPSTTGDYLWEYKMDEKSALERFEEVSAKGGLYSLEVHIQFSCDEGGLLLLSNLLDNARKRDMWITLPKDIAEFYNLRKNVFIDYDIVGDIVTIEIKNNNDRDVQGLTLLIGNETIVFDLKPKEKIKYMLKLR